MTPVENPGSPARQTVGGAAHVGVALVNWNAREELARCLETLFRFHPGLTLEVLVVDNASSDGSVAMLKEKFPQVKLIENLENRGFAAACNQAFAALDPGSRYVLVLNPDVLFTGDTLVPLLGFLEKNPGIHVVTPRILNPDGSFQPTCRRRDPTPAALLWRISGLSRLFPASRFFAGYTYGETPEEQMHEIEAASGSFLFLRREALESAGGFDERFFLYAEDLDWCLRAREKGLSIYYFPGARVVHLRGASSSRRPLAGLWHRYFTAGQYLEKNCRQKYPLPVRGLLYLALALFFLVSAALTLIKQLFYPFKNRHY